MSRNLPPEAFSAQRKAIEMRDAGFTANEAAKSLNDSEDDAFYTKGDEIYMRRYDDNARVKPDDVFILEFPHAVE